MKSIFTSTLTLFAVVALAMTLFVTCSKDDSPVSPPTDNTVIADSIRPIVFVHGRLGAADTWSVLIHRFLFSGNNYHRGLIFPLDLKNYYGGTFTSIDVSAMANQIDSYVNMVLSSTGHSRVDVIAHDQGVQAMQHYLTKKGGTSKVAHFAAIGGIIDNSLTSNGTLTPTPVKYMTVTSDGNDATQSGDATRGTFPGKTNSVRAGLDHQQIICHTNTFKDIYSFFTGKQPARFDYGLVSDVRIAGKVISIFDNQPIAGAKVIVQNVNYATGLDALGTLGNVTTDNDGNWGPILVDAARRYVRISVTATNYHEMHTYRQAFRDSSFYERVRMIPKSGGSGAVQSFASAIPVGPNHSVLFVYTPNRALYFGRNTLAINTIETINDQTGPIATAAMQGSNTILMAYFDYQTDQKNGTGPMPIASMNTYGINSFDLFISAVSAGQGVDTQLDTYNLKVKNWRSQGTLQNNNGLVWAQHDSYQ